MKVVVPSRPSMTVPAACALALGGLAAAAAPAAAVPPGETLVFQERTTWQPFAAVQDWPCLGTEGQDDDAALVSGVESRHVTVTAAGMDAQGPVAPYTVRFTGHVEATIDPLDEDLPTYSGASHSVFRQRVNETGRHTVSVGRFRAVAADGSALTFRFRLVVVISRDGQVRVEREIADCRQA